MGDAAPAVLPPRVYLRAHVGLIAEEIGTDVPETLRLFDQTFPVNEEVPLTSDLPRVKLGAMAVAAGLTGAGIIAVILAFTR
jgi:hypothetical protein